MQSPSIEWTAAIAYLAFLDWYRNRGDPDGDTLTEVVRVGFHTDRAEGRAALGAAIAVGGGLLYRHFTKHEMRAANTRTT